MKKFLHIIINNPYMLFKLIYLITAASINRLNGVKTILCNIQHNYFFDIFKPVYMKLRDKPKIKVYFSYSSKDKSLKKYLIKNAGKRSIIQNTISPFVPFDMFICSELTGDDFPVSFFKTKTIEFHNSTGTSDLNDKKHIMKKFDIHFSIGPQFNDFIEDVYDGLDKSPIIYNTGSAGLDFLLNKTPPGSARPVSGPDNKPVILYCPHWDSDSSLYIFGEKIIEILARLHSRIFIITDDRFTKYPFKNLEDAYNITFVRKTEAQDMYHLTDILITDTGTSAALEFSLLHKPIILYYNEKWSACKNYIEPDKDICETAIKFTTLDELENILINITAGNPEIISKLEEQRRKQDILIRKYLFKPEEAIEKSAKAILKEINL